MKLPPNGNTPPQRPASPRPAAGQGVTPATVQNAQPAGAEQPQGDAQRPNPCSLLKEFLKSLPARNKGFAYLFAAAGGAGTGAKVGAVFTLGHPVGTATVSTAYMVLALIAQATKDNHQNISDALMNLEGLTSEAAGTAMKSGPWGLRFLMWTLQSVDVIVHAKANGLSDFETASLVGFTGGFSVLTHTLVIAALIDLIASADKMATRTFGGALEAAGTPLRTVAPVNWSQAVSFGFGPPAVLAWAGAVATGNTDMLIGGFAKSLTKSVAECAVVASGTIATVLFTLCTGYAIYRGDKFAKIDIKESMMDELRSLVPLMVTGARMARVSAVEFAPSQNTCKQVMKDLAQAALSPPVLFGIATFTNYYLAKNPHADVFGLFTATDTGTQPPVDGGDDIHRVAARVLVSTLPYGAAWALELLKGWDLSKSADGVKKLDQVTPTKLGDLEQTLFCLMTAGSVAWTTEVLGAPDAMEAAGMAHGLGVLLSVMVPFGGVIASGVLASNSKRLAADAAVTLAAGLLGGLEPDLHGKEIMLGTLGLWMGGRALIEWSADNSSRSVAAALAQPGGVNVPANMQIPPEVLEHPMAEPPLVGKYTPEHSEIDPLLTIHVPENDAGTAAALVRAQSEAAVAEPQAYVPYSDEALETRRRQISDLLGIPYGPGKPLPADGALSSSGAGNPALTHASIVKFINDQLGPPPWLLPIPSASSSSSSGEPMVFHTADTTESKH